VATIITSLGSRATENVDITAVAGSNPYTITLAAATTTTNNGDTLTDEAATPNSYLITAGAGTTSLTVEDLLGAGTAPLASGGSQATTTRTYSTIALWAADLDDTDLYNSSDDAVGECYNDSVFAENWTIAGGHTVGLTSTRLTVPVAERGDGTADTGVQNDRTSTVGSAGTSGLISRVEHFVKF